MPGRSFEQQVKATLGDLQFKPDAAVWEAVEASLRQERKRRWLIWFMAIVTCCGGGAFWLYQQKPTMKQIHVVTAGHHKTPAPFLTNKKEINKSSGTVVVTLPVLKDTSLKEKGVKQAVVMYDKKSAVHHAEEYAHQDVTSLPAGNHMPLIAQQSFRQEDIITTIKDTQVLIAATGLPVITQSNQTAREEGLAITAAGIRKTKQEKNKKHLWQWGVTVQAGKSGVRNALGLFKGEEKASYSGNPANYNGSSGQAFNLSSPVIKDAFAFSLGVQASKQVSRRHNIGISIGYGLLQDQVGVGKRIDSTRLISSVDKSNEDGFYFKNTDSIRYLNQYHFLQTAVDFYTQYKVFKAVSVRWQLGTGLNVLVASNGLHYAENERIFFRSRPLLTTIQWQTSTGLEVGIGKQPFLYVGPQLTYFISKFSKQPGADQHFFQSSIRATFMLPQKKK
jgi:hypothetical protein